jgi:MYXO-CTERM domain-containing protein
MPMSTLALALALVALPAPAELAAGPTGAQPIIGGELVPSDAWQSVVAIIGIDNGLASATAHLCTGVLLDEQTAMTAAHCLAEAESYDQVLVIFGDSMYTIDPNRRTTAAASGNHPKYCFDDGCSEDAYDYGYVVLTDAVVGVELIPPLVDQGEWDELMVEDHEVTLVGFGSTRDTSEDGAAPLQMSEVGYKREVTTAISGFSSTGIEFIAGSEGRDTCNGDSGGPVFAQLANGEWRLVGITSRGKTPCGSGHGIYGVPYAALPWIRDETGVDLLPAECAAADCLDTAPPKERGCSIVGAEGRGGGVPLGFGLVVLAAGVGLRRRRV